MENKLEEARRMGLIGCNINESSDYIPTINSALTETEKWNRWENEIIKESEKRKHDQTRYQQ